MAVFEEEAWDVSPDVQQLDDGLFGGDKKKKKKKKENETSQNKTDQPDVKTEGKKAKRGKRGKKKSKKEKEAEAAVTTELNGTASSEKNALPQKKKLKLKIKTKLGKLPKENTPKGKSPRNKYKYLAIIRQKEQENRELEKSESNNNKENGEDKRKEEKLEQTILAGEVSTRSNQDITNSLQLEEPQKKKKKNIKKAAEAEVQQLPKNMKRNSMDGSMEESPNKIRKKAKQDDVTVGEPPKKKLKKGKTDQPSLAQTPVGGKEKKTVGDVSAGLFTGKAQEKDYSVGAPSQPIKKKQKGKHKSKEETMAVDKPEQSQEPVQRKKKNKDKRKGKRSLQENTLSSDSDESTESPKKTKKQKLAKDKSVEYELSGIKGEKASKKTGKREDSVTEHSPSKSPFNINRLKHVLNKGSDSSPGADIETVKEVGPGQEGSPKTKAKKKGEQPSLRERMEAQLSGARFRFINEQLYTCTGQEALGLMRQDPTAFKVYHEGFTSQVEKWPQNPVNHVIKFVKARPDAVVADLGCGDAKLSQAVPNKVHSFDLVAVNPRVTACDMAKVPLPDSSVDVAVFCLALMGTNLVDFVCEANRILKTSGTLVVAEVVSRFEKVGSFVRKMLKLGFELNKKDDSNKMFIWFEFTKSSEAPPAERRPALELMPCIYKKR